MKAIKKRLKMNGIILCCDWIKAGVRTNHLVGGSGVGRGKENERLNLVGGKQEGCCERHEA